MNFKAVLALPKTAGSAQTHKSISYIELFGALYMYISAKDMTVPFKIMKLAEVHDKTEITMGLQSFNSLKLEVFCSSRAFK